MASLMQFPDMEMDPDPGFGPGGMQADGASQLDIRALISVLRRRKAMIIGVMAIITGIAFVFVNQLTPRYSASAYLVVEPNRQNVVNIESVVGGLNTDYYTNETEAAVIGSQDLAKKAVDRLDLVNSPMFNPLLQKPKPGLFGTLSKAAKGLFYSLFADPDELARLEAEELRAAREDNPLMRLPPQEREAVIHQYATASYLGGLRVDPSVRSRVITVSYQSMDPEFAALAANTTAELYILDQLSQKGEATSRAGEFLAERVNELRQRVIQQEREIAAFRAEAGIIDAGGITIFQKQLAAANEQLAQARTTRAEADARYQQLQELLSQGDQLDTAAAVLDSSLIGRLREQEAEVIRKLAELRTSLRPGHPRLQLAQNELSDLQEAIKRETGKIAANLRNELQIARIREANIESELARIRDLLNEQNESQATLQSMSSELGANKQLYETFLERLKETDILENSEQQADARIITRASVPGSPFYPNKRMMLIAALVFSAAIGAGLAFLAEFLDSGFRSNGQLEGLTGITVLGSVPFLKRNQLGGQRPHDYALARPTSPYGEAIRSLRTGLLLSAAERPPKTLVVTSAVPNEGKTTTALSIAATAAKSGQRVIIVDCDLRKPRLHESLGTVNTAGLTDFLSERVKLDDVVELDTRSSVHYILAGHTAPNPTDLLSGPRMREFIAQLAESYDLVVLDTPPTLVVSDALVLVRWVDKTLFTVRWEKTRRETVLAALKQLFEANADFAGTVLTQVDIKKQAQYDYSGSGGYQYGEYQSYYAERA